MRISGLLFAGLLLDFLAYAWASPSGIFTLEDNELDQLIKSLKTVEIYYINLEFHKQGGTSASSDMLYLEMQDGKEIRISCNLYPARMRINGISFISNSEGSENIFELYNTVYSRNGTPAA